MDITTLTQVIANLGFPIAACAAMFWKLNTDDKRHQEEVEKLSEAVNNNTLIVQELLMTLKEEVKHE